MIRNLTQQDDTLWSDLRSLVHLTTTGIVEILGFGYRSHKETKRKFIREKVLGIPDCSNDNEYLQLAFARGHADEIEVRDTLNECRYEQICKPDYALCQWGPYLVGSSTDGYLREWIDDKYTSGFVTANVEIKSVGVQWNHLTNNGRLKKLRRYYLQCMLQMLFHDIDRTELFIIDSTRVIRKINMQLSDFDELFEHVDILGEIKTFIASMYAKDYNTKYMGRRHKRISRFLDKIIRVRSPLILEPQLSSFHGC